MILAIAYYLVYMAECQFTKLHFFRKYLSCIVYFYSLCGFIANSNGGQGPPLVWAFMVRSADNDVDYLARDYDDFAHCLAFEPFGCCRVRHGGGFHGLGVEIGGNIDVEAGLSVE